MSYYFVCVAIDINIDSSSTTILYLYGNSYPAGTAVLLGPALDFHPQLVTFFVSLCELLVYIYSNITPPQTTIQSINILVGHIDYMQDNVLLYQTSSYS